ncbi:hypothetical protein [Hanamia caeni]|nr:hypothetical protein [Hanamia caeni]
MAWIKILRKPTKRMLNAESRRQKQKGKGKRHKAKVEGAKQARH